MGMSFPPLVITPCTWAAKPAAPNVGDRIQLTDYGNRIFYWTGTLWVADSARPFAQSGASSSVTGTTTKTTLAQVTIPGGMMGSNGVLRISPIWTWTNSANTKVAELMLGNTSIFALSASTSGEFAQIFNLRNRGSQSAQIGGIPGNQTSSSFAVTGGTPNTFGVDTSIDQVLSFKATLANTGETITLEGYTVEVLPA